ncbi:DMT family transporter [Longivirga aurantiaca]|uniref:DMT family transporter n=1 Tax=Longivirga aurantiaca TaxID=1837743 RepID=A0ABW1SWY4_9ACTN
MAGSSVQHLHPPLWAMVLAFTVGITSVVQARSNGELAIATGDGLLTGVLSLATGLVILVVIVAARGSSRRALIREVPAALRDGRLRWWHFLGGVGGACYIGSQAVTVPLVGVAVFTVSYVAGVTGMSLLVDRWGFGPGGARAVSRRRVLSAVGTTLAVGLAVSGRLLSGDLVWWAVGAVLLAGAVVATQLALNGTVAQRTGDPMPAALINFMLALVLLLIGLGIEHLVGHRWAPPPAPWDQPLLWLGGVTGVLYITVAAVLVKPLGVLLFGLLTIAGQLTGSLLSDLLLPTPGTVVSWQLIAGVLLAGAAIGWAALPPRRARVTTA